ncbi:hypothetical protein J7413_10725 [Shimia sp. R10_1]|uniref:hypothetical protein n=1 Tax=Shimia sp. R10_1 TaxID=2821095 RepID=UPI001ADCBC50|nr:hypothetical protein [Shimia sp. R10_1]MBO9474012.1 hypothetical protein [Shimia sp. R10_1]
MRKVSKTGLLSKMTPNVADLITELQRDLETHDDEFHLVLTEALTGAPRHKHVTQAA